MRDARQFQYSDEMRIGTPGRVVSELYNSIIETGIMPGARAGVYTISYTGTFAPADTITTTINGVALLTTLITGDTTIQATRDRHLATLLASDYFNDLARAYAVGSGNSSTIRIHWRTVAESPTITVVETTAGDGDPAIATTVAPVAFDGYPPGVGVVRPASLTDGREIIVPDQAGRVFVGALMKSEAGGPADLAGKAGIGPGDAASVLTRGKMIVISETPVTTSNWSTVFLRHTAAGALAPGNWRTDSGSSTAEQITNARFRRVCGAGEATILELL